MYATEPDISDVIFHIQAKIKSAAESKLILLRKDVALSMVPLVQQVQTCVCLLFSHGSIIITHYSLRCLQRSCSSCWYC